MDNEEENYSLKKPHDMQYLRAINSKLSFIEHRLQSSNESIKSLTKIAITAISVTLGSSLGLAILLCRIL